MDYILYQENLESDLKKLVEINYFKEVQKFKFEMFPNNGAMRSLIKRYRNVPAKNVSSTRSMEFSEQIKKAVMKKCEWEYDFLYSREQIIFKANDLYCEKISSYANRL